MRSNSLRDSLRAELDKIAVIDSHDHIEAVEFARASDNQLFRTLGRSFIKNDLLNAGVIEPRWKAAMATDIEGWVGLKRHINLCRNTGYFRCFLIAVRDLLDCPIHELTDENWEGVSHALLHANRRTDWYDYVLRVRGHVDVVLWDQVYGEPRWPTMENSLFMPIVRFDRFADIAAPDFKKDFRRDFGCEPTTIADVIDAIDMLFRQHTDEGVAGVKIAAAYYRGLRFQVSSRSAASQVLNMSAQDISYPQLLAYQDFVYGYVIERCISYDLPIQIHTGMQSTSGFLHNGYPLYLEETVQRYPKAKFVLLHAAYPFTTHATALAGRHPNVYLDGSWLPILSPSAYRQTLSEWLDLLPSDRILAWGGDAIRVEMAYGSLVMAKDAIADLLAEKVEKGHLDETKALRVANQILRENIQNLFRTDEVRGRRLKKFGHVDKRVA